MQSAEKQTQSSTRQAGVITCFLSLVLLVILALVFVALESACSAGARFLAQSYTRLAADSVMAEYSSVLFDRYHVFAYNSRADIEEVKDVLRQQTEYYIDRNLQAGNKQLWMPTLHSVEVEDYELLTEHGGSTFRKEAASYMKYRGVSLVAEKLLSSLGFFKSAQKTVKVLETKAKTEESLAEIDACILELFESVDGFRSDEDGIQRNLWGRIRTKEYFVKKLLFEVPTQTSAQINHPVLFEAIRDSYRNPQTELSLLELILEERAEVEEQASLLDFEMNDVREELQAVQLQLRQVEEELLQQDKEEKEELLKDLKKELVGQSGELVRKIKRLEEEQQRLSLELRSIKERFHTKQREWKAVVEGCYEADKSALRTMETIRIKQQLAKSKVVQYESELLQAVEWMDASLHEELSKGIETMRQYVNLETKGVERVIDPEGMQETLKNNGQLLSQILQILETAENQTTAGARHGLSRMSKLLASYSHQGLRFDYSGLHLESEGTSPVKAIKELLEKGIAALVIKDSKKVSQEKINEKELPSLWYELEGKNAGQENGADKAILGLDNSNASTSLSALGNENPFAGIGAVIEATGEALLEQTLFLSYLADHFSSFESGKQEDSVLAYEQEYILCGKKDDAKNLNEMIGKLLMVRLIFNLIHVMSDTEKSSSARETAMALLGATGLPILVSILKFLILFIWAAEGALVETAALLQGKKLAIMPQKKDFPVAYSEILVMSRTRILQKAEAIKDKGGLTLGYSEYLLLFLLMQKEETQTMRTLDLIQENLRIKEDGFLARRQVCSFSVKVEYAFSELFTSFSFVKRKTGGVRCRTGAFSG